MALLLSLMIYFWPIIVAIIYIVMMIFMDLSDDTNYEEKTWY